MPLADQDLLTLTDEHISPLFCFACISVFVLLIFWNYMFSRFEVPYDLHVQTMFGSFWLPFGLSGIHDLLMLCVFDYIHLCPHDILWCVCRLAVIWRVSLVEQKRLAIKEHLSLLRFYWWFVLLNMCCSVVYHCLFLCIFYCGYCSVCPSSIYGFKLSLLYLQTFLAMGLV
jgi:hypothetical protein